METYITEVGLTEVNCGECGGTYAISSRYHQHKRTKGGFWTCPYCKSGWGFSKGESEAERLQKKLDKKQREIDAQKMEAANMRTQRDKVLKSYTTMRDRVKNGVCPCCNRTFQNLMNHMKAEHPEFGAHDLLKQVRAVYGMTQSAVAAEAGVNTPHISRYEREKPIPEWAKREIDSWMAANA